MDNPQEEESTTTSNLGATTVEAVDVGESQPLREVQRRREFARFWIALILLIVFSATVIWVLFAAFWGNDTAWKNTKDALQILLPVEASLLGSAISFYFATRGEDR